MLHRFFSLNAEEIEKIGKETSYYSIGFVTVSLKDNIEDAVCAGSGTLVTVGSVHGILTAAHVLDALPKTGQVGLVVEIEDPSKYQKQLIDMAHTDIIMMRAKAFDQYRPDLGFLRLPQADLS